MNEYRLDVTSRIERMGESLWQGAECAEWLADSDVFTKMVRLAPSICVAFVGPCVGVLAGVRNSQRAAHGKACRPLQLP